MKRKFVKAMAIAAFAAVLPLTGTIPAYASVSGTSVSDNSMIISGNPLETTKSNPVKVESWYQLDGFDDTTKITFYNDDAQDSDGNFKDFRIASDKDAQLYVGDSLPNAVTTGSAYHAVSSKEQKKIISFENGAAEFVWNDTTDSPDYVQWSVETVGNSYFTASVDGRTLTLTPSEFGTSVYKYTGKVCHNGCYIGSGSKGDVTGYFAVTTPLNYKTLKSLVDASLTLSSDDVSTASDAAETVENTIQKIIDARNPKVLQLQNTDTENVYKFDAAKNVNHNLDVTVADIRGFHPDKGFTAHVSIYDKTSGKTYDFGRLAFTINAGKTVFFTDVPADAYYRNAVNWGVENGLIKGISDTEFAPKNTLTREQLILMLYRNAGSPAVDVKTASPFNDTASLSEEAQKAIAWAYTNHYTTGTSSVTFSPKKTLTRAEAVAFLSRVKDANTSDANEAGFTDVKHGSWYEDAVNWASTAGIVKGTSDTTFSPYRTCTRAEGITFLYRAFA